MITYYDEQLCSYLLTEEGKKLDERDLINLIGVMEHESKMLKVEVITCDKEYRAKMEVEE